MIAWLIRNWRVALALAVVAGLGYGAWRIDAAAYARGVRDQKIIALGEAAALNARIRDAEDAARDAAIRAGDAARELMTLQMENARERARDPLASGSGLPPGELRRVFRITGTGYD